MNPSRTVRVVTLSLVVANLAALYDPDYHLREVTRDQSEYYLRKGEAPGRWAGAGAVELGLGGEVGAEELRAVFAGKHPITGEWLTSARGSAVRARARDGDRLLDAKGAAAALGVSRPVVYRLLRSGALAGEKVDGQWRISEQATNAYLVGGSGPGGRAAAAGDGMLTVAEAADRIGVSASYLFKMLVEAPPPAGAPDRPYIVAAPTAKGWRIREDEVSRFAEARQAPKAVPAYDLALRAPKSVSIVHALGGFAPAGVCRQLGLGPGVGVSGAVLAAHQAAVAEAVRVLERHGAWVRGPGGSRVKAKGMAIACFDHRASRSGDPLLHTHLVIANTAVGLDGRRAALDSTALYAWARTVGHVYQAALRRELVHRLGVRFDQPHEGSADLAGMPRRVIERFSTRRREILAQMAATGATDPAAAQAAALATRRPKDDLGTHGLPPEAVRRMAEEEGFSVRNLTDLLRSRAPAHPDSGDLDAIADHLASPDGLCERTTRVDLRDAICGFANQLPAGAGADQLEGAAGRLLSDPARFVPVAGPTRRGVIRRRGGTSFRAGGVGTAYTTPELLAHEERLVALYDASQHPDAPWCMAGASTVDAAVAESGLRADQARVVHALCASGAGIDVLVGRPGSGKTRAMAAAASAWRESGLAVIGCALQGGAADVLAAEADLDHQYTLTSLLNRLDREGAGILRSTAVILDEAGMADTRQLCRLGAYTGAAKAKLVLVGDPDQIPEVAAGGGFAHLVDRAGDRALHLDTNHRQTDRAEALRAEAIRQGDTAAAIADAVADGRFHIALTPDALRLRLLDDWAADPGVAGRDKLIIATTTAEVENLNAAARARVTATGALGPDAVVVALSAADRAVDQRELRTGDRVRTQRNLRSKRVYTGMVGTVTAVDAAAGTVTVRFDAPTTRRAPVEATLGPAYLNERTVRTPARPRTDRPGLTWAYAGTANSAQGRTATTAYLLATEAGVYRQAAYVMATRARTATHWYGLTLPDTDDLPTHQWPGHLPEPDPTDTTGIAAKMAADGAQAMATIADPDASVLAELVRQPIAGLLHERRQTAHDLHRDDPEPAEARRQIKTTLAGLLGVPYPSLDCPQLDQALRRALSVPGASVDKVTDLVLMRGGRNTRSVADADDPLAVIVWAAGTYAVEQLQAEAAPPPIANAQQPSLEAHLRVLDTAIARVRSGRLTAAAWDPTDSAIEVLGRCPHDHPAALRQWMRARSAIFHYTDTNQPDLAATTPLDLLLGQVPTDPADLAHRRQVESAIRLARASIITAELTSHVPPPPPATAEVRLLAERTLADLEAELLQARSDLRRIEDNTRRHETLDRLIDQAEHAGSHHRDSDPSDKRADQLRRAADEVATGAPGRTARLRCRIDTLEQAIDARQQLVIAAALTSPPPWLLADLDDRHLHLPITDLVDACAHAALAADRGQPYSPRPPTPAPAFAPAPN